MRTALHHIFYELLNIDVQFKYFICNPVSVTKKCDLFKQKSNNKLLNFIFAEKVAFFVTKTGLKIKCLVLHTSI